MAVIEFSTAASMSREEAAGRLRRIAHMLELGDDGIVLEIELSW